jgi:hypothetical protein
MTILEIAHRLDAVERGNRWLARCPAHDDRRPSLSLREGPGGRTLLHCFAGCEPDAIVSALGLRLSDFFDDGRRRPVAARHPQAAEIERALHDQVEILMAADAVVTGFPLVAELARHRNAARVIVERRYGVRLKREAAPWCENEPHAIDPAWAACVDAAVTVAAARSNMSADELHRQIDALPRTQYAVLRLARRFQWSLSPAVTAAAAAA